MKTLGWLAFDIDGTLTLDKRSIPARVVAHLHQLQRDGWKIVLATGRPFAFAQMAVQALPFPFHLIVQNGSAALEMPKRQLLWTNYLPADALPLLEKAYESIRGDFLVYAGVERGDFCFYRPDRFPLEELSYLAELQTRQTEKWQSVESFDPERIGPFPLAKSFGPSARMQKLREQLHSKTFEVAQIRDTYTQGTDVLLITHTSATKGSALKRLIEQEGIRGRVIAAGDDVNDLSLFAAADVAIAMPHAPKSVLGVADCIAPPTADCGIIEALNRVLT